MTKPKHEPERAPRGLPASEAERAARWAALYAAQRAEIRRLRRLLAAAEQPATDRTETT